MLPEIYFHVIYYEFVYQPQCQAFNKALQEVTFTEQATPTIFMNQVSEIMQPYVMKTNHIDWFTTYKVLPFMSTNRVAHV
jgi:hypothetical protein